MKSIFEWKPWYATLDHWRGLAALWVMLYHGFGRFYGITLHPVAEVIKNISHPGWLGVHIFFVISGYCIATSIYHLHGKGKLDAIQFLKRRAERLLPAYWIAFILSIIINVATAPFNSTEIWENFPNTWQAWIGNIFLLQPYLDIPYYVVVYWSLVVEVGFYLIVSGLLLLNQKVGYKIALTVCILLGIISLFLPVSFEIQAFSLWGEFLCGVLVFTALLGQNTRHKYLRNLSLSLLSLLVVQGGLTQFSLTGNKVWISALFAIVLYGLYPLDHKINNLKWLQWLQIAGGMSYSLYLLHVPFQGKVVNFGANVFDADSFWMLIVQVLGWVLALTMSYIFFRTVEKPINEWRKQRAKPTQLLS